MCPTTTRFPRASSRRSSTGRHSPIALAARKTLANRQQILTAAYTKHPERFVNKPPMPMTLPEAVWINPPAAQDQQKGLPATVDPRKPNAPSAHPRSGYPSPGCVPAEPDSVSPDNVTIPDQAPNQQPPSDTRAHASKNPGGVGAGPHIQTTLLAKRDQLH